MKALLMDAARDFDTEAQLPPQAADVARDLALDTMLGAMAGGDAFIAPVARAALLGAPGRDAAAIGYRQAAVQDAVAQPDTVREMYELVTRTLDERRKRYWGFLNRYPGSILHSAVQLLRLYMERLRLLRDIARSSSGTFRSTAFRSLFTMLQREFDDDYLGQVRAQLTELEFARGIPATATLGPGLECRDYRLRRMGGHGPRWLQPLFQPVLQPVFDRVPSTYTVRVAPRDISGGKILGEMRDRSIADAADALAAAVAHIEHFFTTLRTELAFHVGCANLHRRLTERRVAVCFPELLAADAGGGIRARELVDPSLALTLDRAPVANRLDASEKPLIVVTGANQGGKSTFLRSVGLAQLMFQAGMFVTARAFAAAPCTGLFTHFKRAEDATMKHGKLDEELARLGDIADAIRPGAWLLCNESFASTNEREGSELAGQMTAAMLERGIRVVFVTHLHRFASACHARYRDEGLFLRAERLADGRRSFRLVEAAPQRTAHGQDLYREIFSGECRSGGRTAVSSR